jgi:uncharacterized protein
VDPIAFLELIATGALAGFIAGFLGLGGGVILTPLCLVLFRARGAPDDELIRIIFGTNMFLVTVFSISAVIKHHDNKNIVWRTVLIMGPLAVAGSLLGGWVASVTDPLFLRRAFALVLLVSSASIMIKGTAKPVPGKTSDGFTLSEKWLPVLGFITGLLGSMLGIGGGAVMIMPLILLFKLPVEKIAGTSSAIIVFIGIAGTLSYILAGKNLVTLPGWHNGYVWWIAAFPLMVGGVPVARFGAWVNNRVQGQTLRRIFGAALFLIALKIFQ